MKIHIWTILAYAIICTLQIDEKFGLLTVTHSRNGDYSIIQNYLKMYAQTQCYTQLISQINIVWNNQVLPQQTSIMNDRFNWKIPVYFYLPTFNSMDHRYRLPKQSTANLLYSLDDDIIVDCQTFKATFEEYKKVGNGKLGKIVTNQVRGFKFEPSDSINGQFSYQGKPSALYFTISEPGAAFIPRHYLQVYYLRIVEFLEMRNQVIDVKNCDDIFFYAFVEHFYPELPAVYVPAKKGYRNTDPKIGQSKTKNVYKKRSKCITDISEYFGYNPLRYYTKNSSKTQKNWRYGNSTLRMILQQKLRGLSELQIEQGVQKNVDQYLLNKEKTIKQQKLQQENKKRIQQSMKTVKNEETKSEKRQIIDETSVQIKKPERRARKDNIPGDLKKIKIVKQIQATGQITSELPFEIEAIILLLLIIILLFAIVKLWKNNCRKKTQQRIRINQEEQGQFSTIRLPDRY